MDFALINPLLLAFTPLLLSFVPLGQNLAHATVCTKKCQPGSHVGHRCTDGNYLCQECPFGTYTHIENKVENCNRCKTCAPTEITKEQCTPSKNTVCDCPSGHHKVNGVCVSETVICESCKVADDPKCDCELCQRTKCANNPECKKKCATTPITTTSPPPPSKELILLLWLLPLVVVTSLVLLWLLLFFTKKLLRNRDCCLIWSANKDRPVEDLNCREHSHQGSSSLTTPTVHMYEEAPMISSCQSPTTAAPPAPEGLLLPDVNHAATIHDEQPDLWPAIVLYTIIKAVPLRRWKEFLRLLAVADHQLERVELEASVGQSFMEKQYQMLRLWSQRSSAALADVFFALCYMNLSGCAQLLQESLEKLDWRPEPKQRGPTSLGLSGAAQEAT